MSRLSRTIRKREAAIGEDRRDMAAAVTELRARARRGAGSPRVLCASFGGGLVLGLFSGGQRRSRMARDAAAPPQVGSSHAASPSRAAPMATRLIREVLWPIGAVALRAQLSQLLTGDDAQRR